MSEKESRRKVWLYGKVALALGAILGALIGGYAIGRASIAPDLEAALSQWSEEQEAHAATRQDLERTRTRANAAEEAIVAFRRRASALEARRHLSLAVEQLDARNFGTAQDHLRAAGAQLEGAVHPDLSRLSGDLTGTTLELHPDVAAHRARALSAAHQIDAAMKRLVVPDLATAKE